MLIALGVVLAGAFAWVGSLYGWGRAAIGLLMFLGIFVFWARYWRSMMSVPPEPELADVSGFDLRYICSMCGLELKVEVAAKDKPPTHCGEPMVLERSGGPPPLRTV